MFPLFAPCDFETSNRIAPINTGIPIRNKLILVEDIVVISRIKDKLELRIRINPKEIDIGSGNRRITPLIFGLYIPIINPVTVIAPPIKHGINK